MKIFLTVGTHHQSFERLVKAVDELAKKKKWVIVAQIGHTKYTPQNMKSFHFGTMEEIQKHMKNSDAVVTHAGIGSIEDSLSAGKPTIVVPRRQMFGEHTNDHQLDITEELEKEGIITAVYDINKLENSIALAKRPKNILLKNPPAIKMIKDFLLSINS